MAAVKSYSLWVMPPRGGCDRRASQPERRHRRRRRLCAPLSASPSFVRASTPPARTPPCPQAPSSTSCTLRCGGWRPPCPMGRTFCRTSRCWAASRRATRPTCCAGPPRWPSSCRWAGWRSQARLRRRRQACAGQARSVQRTQHAPRQRPHRAPSLARAAAPAAIPHRLWPGLQRAHLPPVRLRAVRHGRGHHAGTSQAGRGRCGGSFSSAALARLQRHAPQLTPLLETLKQAGAAARAAFGRDPASPYMPHLSLLYSDIPAEERWVWAVEAPCTARCTRWLEETPGRHAAAASPCTSHPPCTHHALQAAHCGRGAAAAVCRGGRRRRRGAGAAAGRGRARLSRGQPHRCFGAGQAVRLAVMPAQVGEGVPPQHLLHAGRA